LPRIYGALTCFRQATAGGHDRFDEFLAEAARRRQAVITARATPSTTSTVDCIVHRAPNKDRVNAAPHRRRCRVARTTSLGPGGGQSPTSYYCGILVLIGGGIRTPSVYSILISPLYEPRAPRAAKSLGQNGGWRSGGSKFLFVHIAIIAPALFGLGFRACCRRVARVALRVEAWRRAERTTAASRCGSAHSHQLDRLHWLDVRVQHPVLCAERISPRVRCGARNVNGRSAVQWKTIKWRKD